MFSNGDTDPSGSLNLCLTKTCPGVHGEPLGSPTGTFGWNMGLLSLADDTRELGHKLKLFLGGDDLRKESGMNLFLSLE